MVKVSELLSKQLICLDTATIEGTICNITFDTHLCFGKCLELFCEDDDSPEKKYVYLKNVANLNKDAAVVKNCDSIIYDWQADCDSFNPINCACYNCDGANLGTVRDIILDGARVDKIVLSSREFTPKELLSYSNSLLIFNDTGKPIKINRSKPKVPKPTDFASVQLHSQKPPDIAPTNFSSLASIQDLPASAVVPDFTPSATVPTFIKPSSTKVVRSPLSSPMSDNSYNFLLNKIVRSSIADKCGTIIIPENTTVTSSVIKIARESGKLVQLALRAY